MLLGTSVLETMKLWSRLLDKPYFHLLQKSDEAVQPWVQPQMWELKREGQQLRAGARVVELLMVLEKGLQGQVFWGPLESVSLSLPPPVPCLTETYATGPCSNQSLGCVLPLANAYWESTRKQNRVFLMHLATDAFQSSRISEGNCSKLLSPFAHVLEKAEVLVPQILNRLIRGEKLGH